MKPDFIADKSRGRDLWRLWQSDPLSVHKNNCTQKGCVFPALKEGFCRDHWTLHRGAGTRLESLHRSAPLDAYGWRFTRK